MFLILIGSLVAFFTFGSAMAALYLQRFLPESSRSDPVRVVIGQVSALVSLLLAMVLGTLVGTSFGFFFAQKANLDAFAAQVLQFDQALAEFGPETKLGRAQLKEEILRSDSLIWSNGDVEPSAIAVAKPISEEAAIDAYLSSLQPKSDAQKQALAKANQYAAALEQSRLLMSLQVAGQSVPSQLVAILAVWAVALFFSYGLFAPNDFTIVAALAFGAVSIGLAIFLIFDLRQPYTGLFRISPAALEETFDFLNK